MLRTQMKPLMTVGKCLPHFPPQEVDQVDGQRHQGRKPLQWRDLGGCWCFDLHSGADSGLDLGLAFCFLMVCAVGAQVDSGLVVARLGSHRLLM